MHKLSNFLKLIRVNNLIIVISIQLLMKFYLINPFVTNFSLGTTEFILYLIATITIIAAGYIINDILDIKTDKINKSDRLIIDKHIPKKHALRYYFILNIIGISSGFNLAIMIGNIFLGFIFLYFILTLWVYSKKLKQAFLIGNLQVSFLTALSIINIILFDILPEGIGDNQISVIRIIIIYSLFSFIMTLIREIIKDLEDIKGDINIKASTLAIKLGIRKSKLINCLLIFITFCSIIYIQIFQYQKVKSSEFFWGVNNISIIYCIIIQILLIKIFFKTYAAQNKKDFHHISTLTKLIMIIGILSIPIFTYIYVK